MKRDSLEQAVAVVGLGCVLPDATSPEAFWQNTLRGHSALRPLGGPQWERCYDADAAAPDRSYTLLGARVERYSFDWRRFRMPPAEVERVNPLQLMILEAGVAALSSLRVLPAESTGVILGATGLGWQRDSGLRIRLGELCEAAARSPRLAALPRERREAIIAGARAALESRLQPVSEDNVVNAAASVAAGRIAMHLDLRGLHYAVDAGFASSLAALDVGVRLLRDRTLDAVLVGGASELLTPLELVAFAKLGGLARQRVAPFDASAEGTLLGEGAVTLALKRLGDALRDGEKIYAVVRGVGGSSDGRGRALCAPSWEGQALAMRRAYLDAGVQPDSVGFVECHATGTRVGDVSEVRALGNVYQGAAPGVALGSAKPFVGHLRAAAGAVGLLRATLALHHRLAPAQINFTQPSPALELGRTPFFVPTREHPLSARGCAAAPRAAVSAFGFGGNNFHAVLEAWDEGARPVSVAVPAAAPPPCEPIAIIGMGGAFPGADGVDAFWHLLERGADMTREVPADRWDIDRYYDPDKDRQETCYTRLGCFLDKLPGLEERWRIPPAAAPTIDPGQLLMLKVTEEALSDAGFEAGRKDRDQGARWDRDRVAVMLAFLPYQGKKFLADVRVNCGELLDALSLSLREAGVPAADARAVLAEAEAEMKAGLPPITEDTLTGYLGSINAARITSHFDFHGPHFVVDSACASAHAALHAAVQGLRQRTCDVAIAGGTWCDMMPEFFIAACRFQALSARGSTPFGAGADGFVPGEGAGALVLRRLADAERDGQKIYAVIRSVAGSSDGRGRSVLAPSPAGEALAMARALKEAEVAPSEVDYVECHGTGTALGDAVEVEACTRAYGPGRPRPLLIGSVKSNIGHLNAAAGVPALIKAALAVQRGQIPASLKAEIPNPKIDFSAGPVQVATAATAWPRPPGGVRRAGVSSFGVGGSNLHVIIEEHRPALADGVAPGGVSGGGGGGGPAPGSERTAQDPEDSEHILPIAAATADSVAACAEELGAVLGAARGLQGRDYLAALRASQQRAAARRDGCRVTIVAETPEELGRRLELLRSHGARQGALLLKQGIAIGSPGAPPRLAAVFPGQGPQYPDMLRAAAARFPLLRRTLDEIDRAYEDLCGRKLTTAFFTTGAPEEQRDEDIHCAVFAVGCALFRLLVSYGLRPDAVMGQSAGELAALVAAGVLDLRDALRAMRERTLAVLSLDVRDPGQMVALSCGAAGTAPLLRGLPGYATIAADNSPAACIVSAERAAVTELLARCAAAGVEAQVLPVSHGYHSRIIAGAQPRYRAVLEGLTFRRPGCDVVSTVTGESLRDLPPGAYPAHLARQYVEPVRLVRAVETLYDSGARLFIECGPKWPLTSFIGQILGERPHAAQAVMHPKVGEVEQIHRALGCLFAQGLATLAPVPTTSGAREAERSAPPPTEVKEMRQAGPAQDEVIALLRSIHERVGAVLDRWDQAALAGGLCDGTSDEAPQPSAAPAVAAAQPAPAQTPAAQAQAAQPAPAQAPIATPQAATPAQVAVREAEVRSAFLRRVMDRTGYPEDMLDLDLDLEADLGIDTVKQIAIVADTRSFFGLQQDPDFKLRDHNTPRKIISYLLSRLSSAPSSLSAPAAPRRPTLAPAPAATRGPRVLTSRTIAAGDPGTHSAGADARPLVTESRCLQLLLSAARRDRAADRLSSLEDLRVGEPAFLPAAGPLSLEVVAEEAAAGLRCRVTSGGVTHLSAAVRFEAAAAAAPPLPPEIRVVLDRRGKPQNGMALLTSTRRGAPQAAAQQTVMWAWGSRFDEVVGGLRLGEISEDVPEAALGELLTSAFWLADFGWYGLSGAVHWLSSLRAARFFATPRPGDELLLHARLLPPEGGTWGADVVVTDGALQVVAQLQGLRGRPAGQLAGALGVAGTAEEAAVDWQHFYRRMHSQLLEGEDRTW